MTTGRINQVCTSPPPQDRSPRAAAVQKHLTNQRNMLESKLQIRENLTHERLAGKESAAMLFPLHCQTGRVQQKMHKLTLIDNCTEVLLPTQAFEACSHHLTAAAILIPVSPSPLHQPTWSEGKTARANLIYQNWSGSRGIPHPTPLPIVRFRRPPRSLI